MELIVDSNVFAISNRSLVQVVKCKYSVGFLTFNSLNGCVLISRTLNGNVCRRFES